MYTKSHVSHAQSIATALASQANYLAGLLARQATGGDYPATVGTMPLTPEELARQQVHWEAVQREFARLTEQLTPPEPPEAA
jgi:hypothetical protein